MQAGRHRRAHRQYIAWTNLDALVSAVWAEAGVINMFIFEWQGDVLCMLCSPVAGPLSSARNCCQWPLSSQQPAQEGFAPARIRPCVSLCRRDSNHSLLEMQHVMSAQT